MTIPSYLQAPELHYVMYRLLPDRMGVIEINLIFLKLAPDYDLSRSQNLCPPQERKINFLPHVCYAFIGWCILWSLQ